MNDAKKDSKFNPNNYNYLEELSIDTDALDVEWLMQPQLFMKWAELYVEAELLHDKAKEKLEYVRASIDSKVRSNPSEYTKSEKKPTETQINGIITIDEEYKEASANFISAKKSFKNLGLALKAFEQRKSALENLVKLHGQTYFASPTVNSERTLSESVRAANKRKEEVQDKIKRRLEWQEARIRASKLEENLD